MQNNIIIEYDNCKQLLLDDKIKKIYSHILSFGFGKEYLLSEHTYRTRKIIEKAYPKIYDNCYKSNRMISAMPKMIDDIYNPGKNGRRVIYKLLKNIVLNEQDCPENKNILNEVFEIIKDSKIFGKHFNSYEKYVKMSEKEFLIEEENFKKNCGKICKNNFDLNGIVGGIMKVTEDPNVSDENILNESEKTLIDDPDLLDKDNLRLFEYVLFKYYKNLVNVHCVLNGYYNYIKNAETSFCGKCKMKIKLISTKYLCMRCDVCGKTYDKETLGHYCISCDWFKCEKCKYL
jgi:hypothetical protein